MKNDKKVLIVEDERPLAHALEMKLTSEGMMTSVARNGEECLELLKENTYDVILLDMMMPVMDGFQVLQKLHNSNKDVPPIVVLSNLSMREDEERILALGAKDYFVKAETPLAKIVEYIKNI